MVPPRPQEGGPRAKPVRRGEGEGRGRGDSGWCRQKGDDMGRETSLASFGRVTGTGFTLLPS